MGTELDLDDVVSGNWLAVQQLTELRAENERLREAAHAAHHLLCNKHLMCADPDDDGSLDHHLRLLQAALDAARADAAE